MVARFEEPTMRPPPTDQYRFAFLLLTCAILCGLSGCTRSGPRVVLYCSQDRQFAETLLEQFSEQAGLPVVPKFDTEANKSVSLYQEIVAEKDHPRCDVFWNNEILSTLRLQRQGLLEAWESPSAKPYPVWAKAKDHTWHAFAGRARILLVSKSIPEAERPRSLLDLTQPQWKGKVVMGKPHHSTSATHAACLFEVLGSEKAREFYLGLKANDVQLAPGNKQVAEWVGKGKTPLGQEVLIGITDTDDALDEVRAGREVVIVFPDRDAPAKGRMGTLFIPNTVVILKGCPNRAGARKLVDFLLSAETERQLAEGPSGQIPLNPKVKAKLPAQIATPGTVKAMEVDWEKAAALWDETQRFLTKEFAAP
jgi:iron(III) transport system substrate-binding protein